MRTDEEGFWVNITGQDTEGDVVGTPVSAKFCGQLPETCGI